MKAILKLTVMMLVLAGSLGSCDKENGSINGVWESYSYPDDAMVTLTIHSNRVAVTTSPNDADGLVFHHGDRLMILRDTLFLVDPNASHNKWPAFAKTFAQQYGVGISWDIT